MKSFNGREIGDTPIFVFGGSFNEGFAYFMRGKNTRFTIFSHHEGVIPIEKRKEICINNIKNNLL